MQRSKTLSTVYVDLPRIELGTVQCECTGIPLTYKPDPNEVVMSGPEEIRTLNPFHAMEVRYHCATGPKM